MASDRPPELVCTLPNGEVSMPVAPISGRTGPEMVHLACEMITAALTPERLPDAVWSIRNNR